MLGACLFGSSIEPKHIKTFGRGALCVAHMGGRNHALLAALTRAWMILCGLGKDVGLMSF